MAGYFGANVVVLGRLNPAIFQPQWFAQHDLLPQAEIRAVESPDGETGSLLVSHGATILNFESLQLQVGSDRWILSTSRVDWVNDLGLITASVFRLLPHTPVSVFGMNYGNHLDMGEQGTQKMLNQWLPCGDFGRLVSDNAEVGGKATGTWRDYKVTIILERSLKLKNGLFLSLNFERQSIRGTEELTALLVSDWKSLIRRSKEIRDMLVGEEPDATE